ncbi:LysR family transcriptional regulator [Streptomyces sp. NPDC094149]|uniref:helix-turn-helix domain-containing protein n=1 Tax=Streptomyces sp. NPDC094149 TaxID=3155079 RepID=UPI003331A97F
MTTWKQQYDEAVRKQKAALDAYQAATDERAQALIAGVWELGSQAAVARELGVTKPSVNQAIRAYEKKTEKRSE